MMATMTISLPDSMKEWVEEQIGGGEYASTSDYVRDLVRRDRARRERKRREKVYTVEELRALLAEARAGGTSAKTMEDIKAEGLRIARVNGWLNEPL